uniref:HTH-type transcriptional activator NagR n=2 Tax=Ralstonia TaxID=48736 RepID=A0A0S4VQ69_RALSL|nr:HTH-type transcriptional activator NagR [Ralstonia solanacearum]CUV36708.1 HTH-type transcriptional activator NagR [Ralstonia solanacearum]CUV42148.1 HTH-type transcriptional activator NagR [Ralstonia solanacearum]CUV60410.1 HTH-type transcriptional activator NagR [Ralstonia solanacearum]
MNDIDIVNVETGMLNLRDVDLNLLVVFQEILREKRIATVAQRLGLSQPAVSNALARLRQTFDDELFVRTPRGMMPTARAEQLAEPVAMALDMLQRAFGQRTHFEAATSTRTFTIAMSDVGEVYFMPVLAQLCTEQAPGVRIDTLRAGAFDMKVGMESGAIDLAIGAFDDLSGESVFQRRLFQQDYVTMFRRGHPLEPAAQAGRLTLERFRAASHLVVASSASPYNAIGPLLDKAGISQSARFSVPHFVAVPYIVSTTDLVVTVPRKLAERAAPPFGLQFVPPPLKLPALQTNVFWHRRFHQDAGNQWLRNLVARHFAEVAG